MFTWWCHSNFPLGRPPLISQCTPVQNQCWVLCIQTSQYGNQCTSLKLLSAKFCNNYLLSLYVTCLFFKVHPNAISDSLPVHLSCQFQSHDLLDQPAYSKQNSPAHCHCRDPECSFPPASLGSPIHNHST